MLFPGKTRGCITIKMYRERGGTKVQDKSKAEV